MKNVLGIFWSVPCKWMQLKPEREHEESFLYFLVGPMQMKPTKARKRKWRKFSVFLGVVPCKWKQLKPETEHEKSFVYFLVSTTQMKPM